MSNSKNIEKIDNLIKEANKIKFKLLEASNYGSTVISPEQALELIRELRDKTLREILGDD